MLRRSTALLRLLIPAALLAAGVIVPLSAGVASAAQPICLTGNLQFDYLSAEGGIPQTDSDPGRPQRLRWLRQGQPTPDGSPGLRSPLAGAVTSVSVVEQPEPGAGESDLMLAAGVLDLAGTDRSAGFGDVADAVLVGMVDVVAERQGAV